MLCFPFTSSIFCVCVLLDSYLCAAFKVCPAGWFKTATSRSCLKVIHTLENWTGARTKCQAENGDLVIKLDKKKRNSIFANNRFIHVWIGLNDRRQEGTFNWLDDTQKITNIPWAPSQPKNNQNEDCVVMIHNGLTELYFDEKCFETYYYVCEKSTECTNNTFGENCSEKCNQNCGGPNNACDIRHGMCSDGCDNGYQGEKCEASCENNTFGANCSETCSKTCGGPHNTCDHVNGSCIFGCVDGYQGERCENFLDPELETDFYYSKIAIIAALIFVLGVLTCFVMFAIIKYSPHDTSTKRSFDGEETMLRSSYHHEGSLVNETARSFSNEEHSNFQVRYVSQKNDSNVPARSVLVQNHSHFSAPSQFYDTETVPVDN